MKQLGILTLAAAVACAATAFGQTNTAYTDPSGYVTVPIAKPAAEGQSKLTAFSVTLRQPAISAGNTTSVQTDSVTKTDAGWSAGEWIAEPHLLCLTNTNGAEECYLITGNTSDTVSLDVGFDLTSRYSNSANAFKIVKASTFASLFGAAEVPFRTGNLSTADLLYVWDGQNWVTYYHSGSNWKKTGSLNSANNDVIFPDEGIFILRRGTTDLNLIFTGAVPTKPQVTTVPGNRLTMVASRYPVGTTVAQLGFHNLPGWQDGSASTGDRFFLWNGTNWLTYYRTGGVWKRTGTLSAVDNEVIPSNALLFVQRVSSGDPANASNVHDMPYNLDQ